MRSLEWYQQWVLRKDCLREAVLELQLKGWISFRQRTSILETMCSKDLMHEWLRQSPRLVGVVLPGRRGGEGRRKKAGQVELCCKVASVQC